LNRELESKLEEMREGHNDLQMCAWSAVRESDTRIAAWRGRCEQALADIDQLRRQNQLLQKERKSRNSSRAHASFYEAYPGEIEDLRLENASLRTQLEKMASGKRSGAQTVVESTTESVVDKSNGTLSKYVTIQISKSVIKTSDYRYKSASKKVKVGTGQYLKWKEALPFSKTY
jgi:4-hydroxy-L-threonine phosphate dehydrogenase PdxA